MIGGWPTSPASINMGRVGCQYRRTCFVELSQRCGALSRILQGSLDVTRRGAAGDVVQGEHFREAEFRMEGSVEGRVDRLQVGQGKFLQVASAVGG